MRPGAAITKKRVGEITHPDGRKTPLVLLLRKDTSDEKVYREIFAKEVYSKRPRGRGVLLTVSAGDVVLDLGAHVGCFAAYSLVKGAKKVVCYEADPENFAQLQKFIAYNRLGDMVTAHRAAVTNAPRKKTISFYQNPKPGNSWRNSAQPTSTKGWGKLTVPHNSFGKVLRDNRGATVIKLDIEGSEVDILQSATIPRKVRLIVFEFTVREGRRLPSIERNLKSAGLTMVANTRAYKPHPSFKNYDELVFAYREGAV
tara:strand:- start:1549 stop:2319 length:771 start_codon:yes stop_codon:yes gene_type:complete